GTVKIGASADCDELVLFPTRKEVLSAGEPPAGRSNVAQGLGASLHAEALVERVEKIDVDEEHRHGYAMALGELKLGVGGVEHVDDLESSGDGVTGTELKESGAE